MSDTNSHDHDANGLCAACQARALRNWERLLHERRELVDVFGDANEAFGTILDSLTDRLLDMPEGKRILAAVKKGQRRFPRILYFGSREEAEREVAWRRQVSHPDTEWEVEPAVRPGKWIIVADGFALKQVQP